MKRSEEDGHPTNSFDVKALDSEIRDFTLTQIFALLDKPSDPRSLSRVQPLGDKEFGGKCGGLQRCFCLARASNPTPLLDLKIQTEKIC